MHQAGTCLPSTRYNHPRDSRARKGRNAGQQVTIPEKRLEEVAVMVSEQTSIPTDASCRWRKPALVRGQTCRKPPQFPCPVPVTQAWRGCCFQTRRLPMEASLRSHRPNTGELRAAGHTGSSNGLPRVG